VYVAYVGCCDCLYGGEEDEPGPGGQRHTVSALVDSAVVHMGGWVSTAVTVSGRAQDGLRTEEQRDTVSGVFGLNVCCMLTAVTVRGGEEDEPGAYGEEGCVTDGWVTNRCKIVFDADVFVKASSPRSYLLSAVTWNNLSLLPACCLPCCCCCCFMNSAGTLLLSALTLCTERAQ
jgi:hypothetical protein